MTTPDKILIELAEIPSTTDAIATRVRVPSLVIQAMLYRHRKDGLVADTTGTTLQVWNLTELGRERAASLQPPCTP